MSHFASHTHTHQLHVPVDRQAFSFKTAQGKSSRFGYGHAAHTLNDVLPPQGDLDTIELTLKRLPPQVSYRAVFLLEYASPLLIVLVLAARPAVVYGDAASGTALSDDATLMVQLWTLHYVKRLLETLFVHKFSRPVRARRDRCRVPSTCVRGPLILRPDAAASLPAVVAARDQPHPACLTPLRPTLCHSATHPRACVSHRRPHRRCRAQMGCGT